MITYLSVADVVDSAVIATKQGGKFQTNVRLFIAEDLDSSIATSKAAVAEDVAVICTDYRAQIDSWIDEGEESEHSADSRASRKKQVLNRINDVSRICKELLDHSITCINRKEGIYGAKPISEKSELPATAEPEAESVPEVPETELGMRELLIGLMDKFGDLEVGGMVAMLIDERVPDATGEIPFETKE